MSAPVPLPPVKIRQGGGPRRYDDETFVQTARDDIELLTSYGLRNDSTFIDLGCGPGRIAIGLIEAEFSGEYLGIEVNERHVEWATEAITTNYPNLRFVRVDAPNERYNPTGTAARKLPADDASVDFICAFSVFSHLLTDESRAYLDEFRRVLTPDGRAYITAYVADGVPDETENPDGPREWKGRLHCVEYSTDFMRQMITDAGLTLVEVVRRPGRKQTGLVLQLA